jgi:hypothetical protein
MKRNRFPMRRKARKARGRARETADSHRGMKDRKSRATAKAAANAVTRKHCEFAAHGRPSSI